MKSSLLMILSFITISITASANVISFSGTYIDHGDMNNDLRWSPRKVPGLVTLTRAQNSSTLNITADGAFCQIEVGAFKKTTRPYLLQPRTVVAAFDIANSNCITTLKEKNNTIELAMKMSKENPDEIKSIEVSLTRKIGTRKYSRDIFKSN